MAVQQHRVSKQHTRQRKAANAYRGMQTNNCDQCGEAILPHRACKACGYYKGRQVLTVEAE